VERGRLRAWRRAPRWGVALKVRWEGRVQALKFPVQQIVELCHQLDELLGMFFLLDALAKSDYPLFFIGSHVATRSVSRRRGEII